MVIPEDQDNASSLTDQLETLDITSEDSQVPFFFSMCNVFFYNYFACAMQALLPTGAVVFMSYASEECIKILWHF